MTQVPLGRSAFERPFARAPLVRLVNRFFEEAPTNQVEEFSLLSRPGTAPEAAFGFGRYRGGITEPGAFSGDLFVVIGEVLHRWDGVSAPIPIIGTVMGSGKPAMTIVTGPGFEHLFIADGQLLQFYDGISAAKGTLLVTGAVATLDEIAVDGVHYRWTNGDVNAGTPLGTMGNPFLVNLGASTAAALDNVLKALNATGVPGIDYSSAITTRHTTVEGVSSDDNELFVAARTRGATGNTIPVSVVTGAALAWGAPTLEGGGIHSLNGVATPDDVGIVSLATISSFVIAVASQSQRFFWINPGEITIDPLDFASAESEPDQIISAMAVGDQVWFFGQSSTEAWVPTGDPNVPFQPVRGQAFSRGVIEGTPVVVGEQVLVVGDDKIVYAVGGGIRRVSNHGIEETVRRALRVEAENG